MNTVLSYSVRRRLACPGMCCKGRLQHLLQQCHHRQQDHRFHRHQLKVHHYRLRQRPQEVRCVLVQVLSWQLCDWLVFFLFCTFGFISPRFQPSESQVISFHSLFVAWNFALFVLSDSRSPPTCTYEQFVSLVHSVRVGLWLASAANMYVTDFLDKVQLFLDEKDHTRKRTSIPRNTVRLFPPWSPYFVYSRTHHDITCRIQNTESVLSMNNTEICLTTA